MSTNKKIGKALSRSKAKIITIAVLVIFCAATIYAAAAYSSTVTINVDGIENRITTLRTDAYEIIKQAGIEIEDNDIVDLSKFESGSDSYIRISKAYAITIFDNGGEGIKCIANGTVTEALAQNHITLADGDVLNCDKNASIYEGMEIVIARSFPVIISADGETVTVNMAGGTVSDALDKAVITVDDDDEISAPLDSALKEGMTIKITRVSFTEQVKKEVAEFKTVTKNDSTMYVGQSKIQTKGIKGEKEVTYKEKYVDGKLKETTVVKTVVTKEPVDEVKLVGTKQHSETTTTKPTTTKPSTTASTTTKPASTSSSMIYSASYFRNAGVINWGGYRWTWYSQRVLPGPGLNIPGRHVDSNGYVCDANDYICLASTCLAKGSVVNTPFGKQGKVYDSGCDYGTLDVYTNF